jgi:hypothetical protein
LCIVVRLKAEHNIALPFVFLPSKRSYGTQSIVLQGRLVGRNRSKIAFTFHGNHAVAGVAVELTFSRAIGGGVQGVLALRSVDLEYVEVASFLAMMLGRLAARFGGNYKIIFKLFK